MVIGSSTPGISPLALERAKEQEASAKTTESKEAKESSETKEATQRSQESATSMLMQGIKNANEFSGVLQIAEGVIDTVSKGADKIDALSAKLQEQGLSVNEKDALENEIASIRSAMEQSISNAVYQGSNIFDKELSMSGSGGSLSTYLQAPDISGMGAPSLLDELSSTKSQIDSLKEELAASNESSLSRLASINNAKATERSNQPANEVDGNYLRENGSMYANSFNTSYLQDKLNALLA